MNGFNQNNLYLIKITCDVNSPSSSWGFGLKHSMTACRGASGPRPGTRESEGAALGGALHGGGRLPAAGRRKQPRQQRHGAVGVRVQRYFQGDMRPRALQLCFPNRVSGALSPILSRSLQLRTHPAVFAANQGAAVPLLDSGGSSIA